MWEVSNTVALLLLLLQAVVVVGSQQEDSWIRHNFATTHRRSHGRRWPQESGRRKARVWQDATLNNPFLAHPPPPTPAPAPVPHLRENNIILDEDYDDEDTIAPHLFWLPQSPVIKISPQQHHQQQHLQQQHHHQQYYRQQHQQQQYPQQRHQQLQQHNQHSTSLEGLQHLLEGGVTADIPGVKVQQLGLESDTTHKDDLGYRAGNRQVKHQQRQVIKPYSGGGSSSSSTPRLVDPETHTGKLPVVNPNFHSEGLRNHDHLSKGITHSLQPHFVSHKHFPELFLSNSRQFPQDFDRQSKFPNGLLSESYLQTFPQEEQLPINVLSDDQLPSRFITPDVVSDVGHQFSQDHMTFPEPFMDSHALEEFTHQQPFIHQHPFSNQKPIGDQEPFDNQEPFGNQVQFIDQEPLGNKEPFGVQEPFIDPEPFRDQKPFGDFRDGSIDVVDEEGYRGLPVSLSELNLPSSKDLISAFTNPELTKEGQREECHARNLRACGIRVIDEFNHELGHPEMCRVREEFLDCMEQQREKPCQPHGKTFSREETDLIRDRIKSLLLSARGCILSHSV
ncbi:uncharacterized protein [Cherax quadricarinatus]|uniref:uncharacterized protein n=1 Tax=Cherax quadricarinatus TaxID=27406 RepID=UPI00387EC8AF